MRSRLLLTAASVVVAALLSPLSPAAADDAAPVTMTRAQWLESIKAERQLLPTMNPLSLPMTLQMKESTDGVWQVIDGYFAPSGEYQIDSSEDGVHALELTCKAPAGVTQDCVYRESDPVGSPFPTYWTFSDSEAPATGILEPLVDSSITKGLDAADSKKVKDGSFSYAKTGDGAVYTIDLVTTLGAEKFTYVFTADSYTATHTGSQGEVLSSDVIAVSPPQTMREFPGPDSIAPSGEVSSAVRSVMFDLTDYMGNFGVYPPAGKPFPVDIESGNNSILKVCYNAKANPTSYVILGTSPQSGMYRVFSSGMSRKGDAPVPGPGVGVLPPCQDVQQRSPKGALVSSVPGPKLVRGTGDVYPELPKGTPDRKVSKMLMTIASSMDAFAMTHDSKLPKERVAVAYNYAPKAVYRVCVARGKNTQRYALLGTGKGDMYSYVYYSVDGVVRGKPVKNPAAGVTPSCSSLGSSGEVFVPGPVVVFSR